MRKIKYDHRQAKLHDLDKGTTAIHKMRNLVPNRHATKDDLCEIQDIIDKGVIAAYNCHIRENTREDRMAKSQGVLYLNKLSHEASGVDRSEAARSS